MLVNFINLIAHLIWRNLLPNSRKASFYDVMAGRGSQAFQGRLNEDFAQVMSLLARGFLTPGLPRTFRWTKFKRPFH